METPSSKRGVFSAAAVDAAERGACFRSYRANPFFASLAKMPAACTKAVWHKRAELAHGFERIGHPDFFGNNMCLMLSEACDFARLNAAGRQCRQCKEHLDNILFLLNMGAMSIDTSRHGVDFSKGRWADDAALHALIPLHRLRSCMLIGSNLVTAAEGQTIHPPAVVQMYLRTTMWIPFVRCDMQNNQHVAAVEAGMAHIIRLCSTEDSLGLCDCDVAMIGAGRNFM